MFIRAWAGTVREQGTDHVAQMREVLNTWSSGLDTWRALFLSLLAERLGLAQQAEAGLAVADEALVAAREGHRWYEADVQRIRGELLLKRDSTDTARAEECFRTALDIAGRQSAKSLELRATMSLARLLAKQGGHDKAQAMLAEVYGWFTEGFDTADLKEAKALLDQLRTEGG